MTDTASNEPIKVETPLGKVPVTIRPYATARLRKASRGVFLKYASLDSKAFQGKSKEEIENMDSSTLAQFEDKIPADIIDDINEITLRYMLIEVDGETDPEAMVTLCLDMRGEDFDFLVQKCNEVAGNTSLTDEKKTT